ncbi:C40 family peptidase [soil metagenome]
MQNATCCVPVSPLRTEPAHRSEMVSQQLFGETCNIIESTNDWVKVKCDFDGYEGWCQEAHVRAIESDSKNNLILFAEDVINVLEFHSNLMLIPMGACLSGYQEKKGIWEDEEIVYSGKVWNAADVAITPDLIRKVSYKFLNTSYLWGGKSIFGIDCSGFVQTVFKFLNIKLLRDASSQITQGKEIDFSQATAGDLAFFNNEEGKIIHVGILLNSSNIIHASGKVRLDAIDAKGIINSETLQRTHHLNKVMRHLI